MITDRTIPWRRIAVEGIAIVASILLAFAIDAWWEDRQRAETEQVVLQTLLSDFRGKQVLLSDMNTFSEAIVESVEILLMAASSTELTVNYSRLSSIRICWLRKWNACPISWRPGIPVWKNG